MPAIGDPCPLETELYAAVRNTLDTVASGLTSAESTFLAIQSVLSALQPACTTAHRAASDFAEAWNDRAPCPLSPLPPELRAACFEWLPFPSRIALSHTSRRWRRETLGIPSLWQSVPATCLSYARAVDLCRTMIARSRSSSLEVDFPVRDATTRDARLVKELFGLVRGSASRIRRLSLPTAKHASEFKSIMPNFEAPSLESLEMTLSQSLKLPVNWIRTCAARLTHLQIFGLILPISCPPLRGITVLDATMALASDLRDLFAVFPCLRSLTLRNVGEDLSVHPQTAPPTCLEVAHFESQSSDFSSLLHSWAGTTCAGRRRSLTFTVKDRIPALVAAAFIAAAEPQRSWSLDLRHASVRSPCFIRFHMQGKCELEVTFDSPYPLVSDAMRELQGSPHLSDLQSLLVEEEAVSQLLSASIVLPAVVELTIVDSGEFDSSAMNLALLDASILQLTLRVPKLQSVVFAPSSDAPRTATATVSYLAECVSSCFIFQAGKLRSITIRQSAPPSDDDSLSLLAVAQNVYLDDGAAKQRLDVGADGISWAPLRGLMA